MAENYDLIPTHLTTVVGVRDVTPHMRRVTLAGGLEKLGACAPDAFVYFLLPPRGRRDLTIGTDFTWARFREIPEADQPVGAYYTVRRHRPQTGEIDVDMVLHGDEGAASAWATQCQPGDRLGIWGPRTRYYPPATTTHFLLVADETGVPAVSAIAEQLDPSASARVICEVADAGEELPIESRAALDITWLHRNGAPPGSSAAIAAAVRALAPPSEPTYVFGGAESRVMTAVRKIVRHEWGLPREHVSLTPYWRHPDSPPVEEDD